MTTETVVAPSVILNPDQHVVVYRNTPLPKLPTPDQLFTLQKSHFLQFDIWTDTELERMRRYVPEDRLDFLLRPAQPNPLDFNVRMAQMVKLGNYKGRSFISFGDVTEEVAIPTDTHLMVGVDDGEARRNIRPSENQASILNEKRSPWNPWDGICYVSPYPFALRGRGLDLVASRCRSTSWPSLFLGGDRPALGAYSDVANAEWGAPSCRERRGL